MLGYKEKVGAALLAGALAVSGGAVLAGCSSQSQDGKQEQQNTQTDNKKSEEKTSPQELKAPESTANGIPTRDSVRIDKTFTNSEAGGHAIEDAGKEESYSNVAVEKTGDSSEGDEADFYGDNAAVFASREATLSLKDMVIDTDGKHANAVFSYGESTSVSIADSVIETHGDCSGGLMTTGGATMTASNLNIATSGRSSAAIRSDRGGGTVLVEGGSYKTNGVGSPAIYSTADVTVRNAHLESSSSEGVVIEGKNSVKLEGVELVADNNQKNSDKSDVFKGVMIYQSMSGDAAVGDASFEMDGGNFLNKNGDVFFVNNTVASIKLSGASITNEDPNGMFLRAAAAGWGTEGSNGGQVDLDATNQKIDGNIIVDPISNLNMKLAESSTFTGAINTDAKAGEVYVELDSSSKWVLTADSHITSLSCPAGAIDLNGHTLYVGDSVYSGGESSGTAIERKQTSSSKGQGERPSKPGEGSSDGKQPPSGNSGEKGEPPAKPDGDSSDSGNKKPSSTDEQKRPDKKPDGEDEQSKQGGSIS